MPETLIMKQIDSIFEAQQAYKYTLRTSNTLQRIAKLKMLKESIEKYEQRIYAALQQDLRKSTFEAAVTEIIFIYGEIDFAIKNIGRWMRPEKAGSTMSNLLARNRIYHEPKGVCLIIAPWNYPFQLMMSPLISAIAAGNCAMLKPSELSPATSAVLHSLITETFEDQEICCIEGDAEVSTTLLELPFDHIFFTGSTAIGKIVMTAAAKNLSSVTLELGGKSPVIIDKTANLKKAAEKIAWGKLVNAGQTCIAPDYVLIDETVEKDFLADYEAAAKAMFFDGDEPNEQSYAKIINIRHFNRLKGLIEAATSKGARLVLGGQTNEENLTIYPTVLTGLQKDMDVMQEEIFGPILPVITYKQLDETITIVNGKSKALALYIFSTNKENTDRLIKETSAGGTCVNDVLIHISNPKLPFGGVNASGMGSCHGHFGFKSFSHERAVVFQSRVDFTRLIYPPYAAKLGLLKWLKKLI